MSCFGGCFGQKRSPPNEETVRINAEISSVRNAKLYSYKELQSATQNFDRANRIGRGGFGPVYEGTLHDGTSAAIKVLSAQSEQGDREFLTEIEMISGMEHENLVKLHGCCTERDQRILVYGYLENNSLAQTLLGGHNTSNSHQFSWTIRTDICKGVAKGLVFLHYEIQPPIVHRDIKASNILLDKDFTPKISDFGMAKLFPSTETHISTRVAGTIGYLAPEYANYRRLTEKADIYSFGVLLLEIVSGRCNTDRSLPPGEENLLDRAWTLYKKDKLVQLVDRALKGEFNTDEACRYLKIGLLCTHYKPRNRPTISTVAEMLKGETDVDETQISEAG